MIVLVAACWTLNPFMAGQTYRGFDLRTDAVDPWSDFLVQNKVRNDRFGIENKDSFIIQTRGYARHDYSYDPEGTQKYLKSISIQARAISWLAGATGLSTRSGIDNLLLAARVSFAWLAAAALVLFFYRAVGGGRGLLVCSLLLAGSTGLVLFAQNLHFALFAFVAPLGFLALAYNRWPELAVIAGLVVLSIVNFACRYEFAPLFSLLVLLPVLIFEPTEPFGLKCRKAAIYFLATVAGFIVAAVIHVTLVAGDLGVPWRDAIGPAFGSLQRRTMSFDSVPAPFSPYFFRYVIWTLREGALSMPFVPVLIPKVVVFAFLAIMLAIAVRRGHRASVVIVSWAFTAYLSWYVLGYQHVLAHNNERYDYWLFALTIGLAAILLVHKPLLDGWDRLRSAMAGRPTNNA